MHRCAPRARLDDACRRVIIDGMDRLRDRVILITGSTGIAAAAAERFVAEGRVSSSLRARPTMPAASRSAWVPRGRRPS